jgi:hypothetical protein
VPEYDLYLGVRLAEASSQAMWGSAHYCVQMSPVQVSVWLRRPHLLHIASTVMHCGMLTMLWSIPCVCGLLV